MDDLFVVGRLIFGGFFLFDGAHQAATADSRSSIDRE